MTISVIIATLARPNLAVCVESLRMQSRPANEIVVVDNSGDTATVRRLVGDNVRIIACAKKGCSAARNAGARVATADIIAFIDDDARAHPDWLANIEAAFREAPLAGLAGGVIYDREMPVRPPLVVDRSTPDWFWLTNFGGIGTGTNLAYRRAAFLAQGGFDETLGPAAEIATNEEHYLFFRLVAGGERIAYDPRPLVFHPVADLRSQRRHLRTQRAAAAYVCYLWEHHPDSRAELKRLFRRGRTPLAPAIRQAVSPEWARWLYRGLGLADYLKLRS
jgi:glycosyltransferase involved in cell wall biosynthesis